MIDISKLQPGDVGKSVAFVYDHGEAVRGKLKGWNATTVFVVFKCNNDWANFQNYTGEGCDPAMVYWSWEFAHFRTAPADARPAVFDLVDSFAIACDDEDDEEEFIDL